MYATKLTLILLGALLYLLGTVVGFVVGSFAIFVKGEHALGA